MINFTRGKGIVLWVDENLRRSDHSKLFRSLNQQSMNIEN